MNRMTTTPHPDTPHLPMLKDAAFAPVFILGLHRSGTSVLYNVLAATGRFSFVTVYHLVEYHRILADHVEGRTAEARERLTLEFRGAGMSDRGVDSMTPAVDFAEEYGFLLGDRLSRMRLNPANLPLFTELCRKVRFIAGNDKPILLKNPHDFSNFLFIKNAFPNARFVFIHRHPVRMLSSQVTALSRLLSARNPYVARLHAGYAKLFQRPMLLGLLRFCFCRFPALGAAKLTRDAALAYRYYRKNIARLAPSDRVALTYEQLCESPQPCIDRILKLLTDAERPAESDITSLLHPRTTPLHPSVKRLRPFIRARMKTCTAMESE